MQCWLSISVTFRLVQVRAVVCRNHIVLAQPPRHGIHYGLSLPAQASSVPSKFRGRSKGSSRQGCESGGVRVPVPSIACFGRLAYPGHAEATKHDVLGRKSHKPLCRKLQWWERLGWQAN